MQPKLIFISASVLALFLSFRPTKNLSTSPENPSALATVPLYRLSDPYGYHFYTTNEAEKNATIKDLGYHYEGILGYVFPQQVPGTVPLYRYRGELDYITNVEKNESVKIARHLYTTDQNDEELKFKRMFITVNHGGAAAARSVQPYVSEGIQCYVPSGNFVGAVTIYRLHQYGFSGVDDGDHGKLQSGAFDNLYTNDEQEKFSSVYKYNYTDKGIGFYVWSTSFTR